MPNRSKRTKQSPLSEFNVPLLILTAFALGAGGMWLIMRSSSPGAAPAKPMVNSVAQPQPSTAQPPDVSQLPRADAARTLGDWNYDRQNWPHAVDHYQEAIAQGADNPDVRTDLGNCFRFLDQPQKALEQYEIAQKQNPMHENSLLNEAGLFAEALHDNQHALKLAREFLVRFPNSSRTKSAKQLISQVEQRSSPTP